MSRPQNPVRSPVNKEFFLQSRDYHTGCFHYKTAERGKGVKRIGVVLCKKKHGYLLFKMFCTLDIQLLDIYRTRRFWRLLQATLSFMRNFKKLKKY